ncbi:hypothetical protein TNCV_1419981 [Trichonephila clavipes]|nr:hypothetical protein TNCV_1419981 [Trichonephila clavipes]
MRYDPIKELNRGAVFHKLQHQFKNQDLQKGGEIIFQNQRQSTLKESLGLDAGECIDVCKCIVPSRHGGTLNSRRAANPHLRLVEEEESWKTHRECSLSKLEWNRAKSYCHLHGAQS